MGIAGMTVKEIMKNLPTITTDIIKIIDALVDNYGEGVIFGNVLKWFKDKIPGDDITKELS